MGIDDIRIIKAPYVKEYKHLFPNDYFQMTIKATLRVQSFLVQTRK